MSDSPDQRVPPPQDETPLLKPELQWLLGAPLGLIIIVLAVAWLSSLEMDLPEIRTPRDLSSSSVLPGHALMMPGTMDVDEIDPELTGDWVSQEIGELDWLATDLQGSRMRVAFYGTDLYLLARIGPDASRAYVAVNGEPVEHMTQDDMGSYVNLWGGQTSDQPILLARDLSHGEHLAEVIADGEGELAISGFEVDASTPFAWAFVLGYAGLAAGLFLILRSILYAIHRQSSAVMSTRSVATRNSGR